MRYRRKYIVWKTNKDTCSYKKLIELQLPADWQKQKRPVVFSIKPQGLPVGEWRRSEQLHYCAVYVGRPPKKDKYTLGKSNSKDLKPSEKEEMMNDTNKFWAKEASHI